MCIITSNSNLVSGQRRIRTSEVVRQQIYSLPPLAAWVSALKVLTYKDIHPYLPKNEPLAGIEPATY